MTFQAGSYFTTEIERRLGARLTDAQILPYLNESLGVIAAAASYLWDQVSLNPVTPIVGGSIPGATLGALDTGKKIIIFNVASGTPISKVPQEEQSIGSVGYVDQLAAGEYNGFAIRYAATGVYLQLYPSTLTPVAVDISYHLLPPVLMDAASPTVRWDVPFMDSVLLDMTEAACKRILSRAGWQDREASARSKLQEAVRIYSTDRINTGTLQETSNAMQEKTQLGRT